jgi:hypothetical protein
LDSEELVAALEACTLQASDFSHQRHVQVAWHYLRRLPRDEAAQRFTDALRRYVAHVGAGNKFQLTMTVALLRLIAARNPRIDPDWEAFRQRCPELFHDWRALLDRHYSAAQLERGRDMLLEADREPLP